MMKHWKSVNRRGLALLLALLMCLNLLSLSALADSEMLEEPNYEEEIDVLPGNEDKGEEPDASVETGDENQEELEEPEEPGEPQEPQEPDSPAEGEEETDPPADEDGEEPAKPEEEETVTPVEGLSITPFTVRETDNGGWYQDEQTVRGDSSDAVCEMVDGVLYLKAQTGSGNGRGTDSSNWPTVFINEEVSEVLAAAKDGTAVYVKMTFSPAYDSNKPFGVFINYDDPGNGFVVSYDWNGGWYWQPCDTDQYPNEIWYSGDRVAAPAVGEPTTLYLEWQGTTLTTATANGTNLFGGAEVEFSANTGAHFGIRCASGAEVTISNFEYGVVSSQPPVEPEPEPDYDGECGAVDGTVFYKITDGVLHIWGTGAMKDYPTASYYTKPATGYIPWYGNGTFTSVVVEEGVTSIGQNAFSTFVTSDMDSNYSKLESVSLPSTLTTIGENAFLGCFYLKSIEIPEGVMSISQRAFTMCIGLETVIFPDTLRTINSSAFSDCRSLTSINLRHVETIYSSAFGSCKNLVDVDLGDSLKTIADGAFARCTSLAKIDFPDTLQSIGYRAFEATVLTNVTIPAGVNLGWIAFSDVVGLQNIVLLGAPNSNSDKQPFGWTSATSGPVIFYVDGEETVNKLITGFGNFRNPEYYYFALPEGGTLAAEVAPGKLAPLEKEGFTFLGWANASGNLLSCDADGYSIIPSGTAKKTVYTAQWEEQSTRIEVSATANGTRVLAEIADGKAVIPGGYTVWVDDVQIATIPMGVTSVAVPVDVIGSLKATTPTASSAGSITFPEGSSALLPDGTLVENPTKLNCYLSGSVYGVLTLDGLLVISGKGNMDSYSTTKAGLWGKAVKEVKIMEGVTSVGGFYNCTNLTKVTLPSSVTVISSGAFRGTTALTELNIPENLTQIGEYGLSASGLSGEMVLPSSMTKIGNWAFYNCKGLTSFAIPSTDKHLDIGTTSNSGNVFAGCENLVTIILPDDVTFIGNRILNNCTSLRNLVYLGNPRTTYALNGDASTDKPLTNLTIYVSSSEVNIEKIIADATYNKDNTYNIAVLNGGEIIELHENGFATLAEREGLTFLGWFDDDGNKVETPTGDGSIYTAQWEEPEPTYYTVTFTTENQFFGTVDGSKSVEIKVKEGGTVENMPTAKPGSGYTFIGWKTADGTEFTVETPVTKDITVIARWQVTFTFSDNKANQVFKSFTVDVELGESVTINGDALEAIIAAGEACGWKFLGWATSSSTSSKVVYEPGAPITAVNKTLVKFYAKWELQPTTPEFTDVRWIRIEIRDENNSMLTSTSFYDTMNTDNKFYTVGEVVANDGSNSAAPASTYPYQCTLTLHTQAMIEKWQSSVGNRVLDGEADPVITLYCRASDGRWATWVDSVGSYSYAVNYVINVKLPTYTIDFRTGISGVYPGIAAPGHITVQLGKTVADMGEELPVLSYSGFDFLGWYTTDGEKFTEDTVVTKSITLTGKWIASPPMFDEYAYIWVYFYDTENNYITGLNIQENNPRYISLGEVRPNDGSNSLASISEYPYQCELTLHIDNMMKDNYKLNGYVLNGDADQTVTLYCNKAGTWATWVDKVGTNLTKVSYKVYLEKSVRTGDLEVSLEPVGTLTAGETATFQMTVTNNTNMNTQSTGVSVYLKDNDGSNDILFGSAYDRDGNEITLLNGWQISIGNLAVGESVEFTLKVTIPESVAWQNMSFLGYAWDHYWNDWQYGPESNTLLTIQCGHEWSFTDNGDGTHNHVCSICDHVIESGIAHEFEDGKCVCGALQTYTITIDGTEYEVTHGSTLGSVLPKAPDKEGHTFTGWFHGNVQVNAETVVTSDMTIEAVWDINTYTVTIDGEEHTVAHGGTLAEILPENPTRTGYTFQGWYNGEDAVNAETEVTGAMTITSRWTQNSSGGIISGGTPGGSTSGSSTSGGTSGSTSGSTDEEIVEPDIPLAGTPVSAVFADVSADVWYTSAIQFVYDKNLMTGISADSFAPGLTTTRGMIVTMLHRMEGTPGAFGSGFTDVAASAWYAQAVIWAKENGVVKGYTADIFGPEDSVSREQLAAILFRYAESKGYDVNARADLSGYTDAGEISAYAVEAMSWANAVGLINGTTETTLSPTGEATRAEAAAIFMRFYETFVSSQNTDHVI